MTRLQIALCGLGGQGIVFAARVLARAAAIEGLDVIASEAKGMAQRRASVVSFVKIGDFAGPSIRRGGADLALCLDAVEARNAISWVRPGGICVLNTPGADPDATRMAEETGVRLRPVDAGSSRSANMIVLGAAGALPAEACRSAIEELSPPGARGANLAAFDEGCREAVRLS